VPRLISLFVLAMMFSAPVMAACTLPEGEAGSIIFSTTAKAMQYCNDTDWVNTGAVIPDAPQTGCTDPVGVVGQVIYATNLGVVQFCNGQSWVNTACAAERKPNGPGCGGKPAGTIQYVSSYNELQFCDSTDWVAMGWPCADGSGPAIPAEQEVVAYVSTSTNNLVISSLFDSGDWADGSKRKRLVINSGVTVGSTSSASPALTTGTGRLHSLIIENNGTIAGAGGAANGGAGGNALLVQETSVTVLNNGNLYGGGGGGGKGGTGGGGKYSTMVNEPASGWYADVNYYNVYREKGGTGLYEWYWNYSFITATGDTGAVTVGGYTYYRGSSFASTGQGSYSQIRRTYNATTNTNGGAGGNGGRGQGSDGTATTGLTGTAGGTSAGAGGKGGNGGAYGIAGEAGDTGTTGNRTAGLAGGTGGTAGAAISGSGYTLTNTGIILGSH